LHALPPQHLQPARQLEQVLGRAEDAGRLAKQLDAVAQRIRDRHVPASVPERFAHAVVRVVVQDDEVADVVVFRSGRAIELAAPLLDTTQMREMQDEPLDRDLDQVDRRGFERLEEAAGQSHAHHVSIPDLLALSGSELDQSRLRQRLRLEIREQQFTRALIRGER